SVKRRCPPLFHPPRHQLAPQQARGSDRAVIHQAAVSVLGNLDVVRGGINEDDFRLYPYSREHQVLDSSSRVSSIKLNLALSDSEPLLLANPAQLDLLALGDRRREEGNRHRLKHFLHILLRLPVDPRIILQHSRSSLPGRRVSGHRSPLEAR